MLKQATEINRYTYKRVPDDGFRGFKEINKWKLDKLVKLKSGEEIKELFFKIDENYLLKSDSGTGKTTSFRNFVRTVKSPFISITSRVSLSLDQIKDLRAEGLDVHHYKDNDYVFGDNIIITPESSVSIANSGSLTRAC